MSLHVKPMSVALFRGPTIEDVHSSAVIYALFSNFGTLRPAFQGLRLLGEMGLVNVAPECGCQCFLPRVLFRELCTSAITGERREMVQDGKQALAGLHPLGEQEPMWWAGGGIFLSLPLT